jgi:hypothetical protein
MPASMHDMKSRLQSPVDVDPWRANEPKDRGGSRATVPGDPHDTPDGMQTSAPLTDNLCLEQTLWSWLTLKRGSG